MSLSQVSTRIGCTHCPWPIPVARGREAGSAPWLFAVWGRRLFDRNQAARRR